MRLKVRPDDFRVEELIEIPPPDPRGQFAIYRVEKRGLSTFEVVARVARLFRVAVRDVRFAGLKDKRARAAQIFSVRLPGRDLPRPEATAGLAIEPLHRAARPVDARRIEANRFAIVVRDLSPEEMAPLCGRIEAVRRDGFPNYFDDQRLGGASPERGFVAKLFSEGRAEEALRLFLARPSPKDPRRERIEKRRIAERWGRWAELAREVKGEGAPVVRALARDPADFLGAFRAIEPRLRKLIVSRYQSWLWNEEVARALRAEIPRERRFEIMYRGGTLVFWRALEEAERAAYERRLVPFPQFPLPAALGVRAAAGARPLLVRPRAIAAGPDEPDEAFPDRRKVRLTMELPRGAYATLVAKRLFYEP